MNISDNNTDICNDFSASVMQRGVKSQSFNTTDLIAHLKTHNHNFVNSTEKPLSGIFLFFAH